LRELKGNAVVELGVRRVRKLKGNSVVESGTSCTCSGGRRGRAGQRRDVQVASAMQCVEVKMKEILQACQGCMLQFNAAIQCGNSLLQFNVAIQCYNFSVWE